MNWQCWRIFPSISAKTWYETWKDFKETQTNRIYVGEINYKPYTHVGWSINCTVIFYLNFSKHFFIVISNIKGPPYCLPALTLVTSSTGTWRRSPWGVSCHIWPTFGTNLFKRHYKKMYRVLWHMRLPPPPSTTSQRRVETLIFYNFVKFIMQYNSSQC